MAIALRRMQREVQELRSDSMASSLRQSGILVRVNDDDIFCVRALMIGPPDTPYAGGFFCFEFKVDPSEYPNKPPKGRFLTTDGLVRFNPNLYTNGYICLSVLGTWNGPGWTPMMRISSVLLCLQGFVFTDKPLQNEPGYANTATTRDNEAYNAYVRYHTWRLAILSVLEYGLPAGFEDLLPSVKQHVRDNMDAYQRDLDAQQPNHGRVNESRYIGTTVFDWQSQWQRFWAYREVSAATEHNDLMCSTHTDTCQDDLCLCKWPQH